MPGSDTKIINELEVPIASFRLFALEQAIRSGSSPELLSALERLQRQETDEECLILLEHALAAVGNRLQPRSESSSVPPRSAVGLESFFELSSQQKIHLLGSLSREELRRKAALAPALLSQEQDPILKSMLVSTFAPCWPVGEHGILLDLLSARGLALRSAALTALIRIAPESLLAHLPSLLESQDGGIRAIAIQGLAGLDLESALAHFSLMLLEEERTLRLAALKIAVMLPYERIRSHLLAFLDREQDPELLSMAGVLVQSNPDKTTPYKLWEICEASSTEKQQIIETILRGVTENLRHVGLATAEYEEFIAGLQKWLNQRRSRRTEQDRQPATPPPTRESVAEDAATPSKQPEPVAEQKPAEKQASVTDSSMSAVFDVEPQPEKEPEPPTEPRCAVPRQERGFRQAEPRRKKRGKATAPNEPVPGGGSPTLLSRGTLREIWDHTWRDFPLAPALIGGCTFVLLWFVGGMLFSGPSPVAAPSSGPTIPNVYPETTVTGAFSQSVGNEENLIFIDSGRKMYLITVPAAWRGRLTGGTPMEIRLRPTRINRDGTITGYLVDCRTLSNQ